MSDRTRRWLSWTAVAILAALVSGFLGWWQYGRYEAKAENAALVEANFNADPTSLEGVLTGGSFDSTREWAPVDLSGEFLGDPVILPQRGIAGQAGDHVLSLFLAEDGDEAVTVVVDRGWYPVSLPPAELSAPDGTVTLTGRARPAEPPSERGVRDHQVFAVDARQILEAQAPPEGESSLEGQGPLETPNVQANLYFMAGAGAPGQEDLNSFPQPAANLGNHLSYAFQWWIFSLGSFVGLGVVIRRDIKSESATPLRKKRVSRDIAEEDALIDAQLEAPRPHPEPQAFSRSRGSS